MNQRSVEIIQKSLNVLSNRLIAPNSDLVEYCLNILKTIDKPLDEIELKVLEFKCKCIKGCFTRAPDVNQICETKYFSNADGLEKFNVRSSPRSSSGKFTIVKDGCETIFFIAQEKFNY